MNEQQVLEALERAIHEDLTSIDLRDCRCGKCGSRMHGFNDNGTIRWRCYGQLERGICDANHVEQSELLDHVLGAIESRFANPKTVERLRGILTRKLKERTTSVSVTDLQQQLAKVDKRLAKARRNMALADGDDLRQDYEAVVRELRQERERLELSIQTAQKPPGRTQADLNQRIDKAVKTLQRLRKATLAAPVPKQRELLAMVMESVEVWARRDTRRGPFEFERGVVHLRSDFWLTEAEADNLLGSS